MISLVVNFHKSNFQVSAMAFSTSLKHWIFALAVFCIFFSFCQFGKADNVYSSNTAAAGVLANEYFPGQGGANQNYPETGSADTNPDQIVEQALLCFNEKQIYSSCNEEYRLSQKGELNVPPDYTDRYCHGPCASETTLVLNCIESIFYSFKFYNKATIRDVKETIKSGCGYGSKRGDFNVAKHIQDENSYAHKTGSNIFFSGVVLMIMACRLLQ